jgi:hypothetical protein
MQRRIGHFALTRWAVDADKRSMVSSSAGSSDNEWSLLGSPVLMGALSVVGLVCGGLILSASGAPRGVVVAWVVLGLVFTTITVATVRQSHRHDEQSSGDGFAPLTDPKTMSGSPIRYRTSRFYVWATVAGVAIVTGVGTVGLLAATVVATSPPPIWFTAAFVVGSAVIWYGLLAFFAIDIAVWPSDGRVVFHCLAKDRQSRLAEITAITKPPIGRRGNAVTVRYQGGTSYVSMWLDWNDFIRRVREQNPGVEVKGF